MKKNLYFLTFIIILSSCAEKNYDQFRYVQNSKADYSIVPQPAYMEILNGRFLIDEKTKIFAAKELGQEASFLSEMLITATSQEIDVINKNNSAENKRGIYLILDGKIQNEEGYFLTVDPDKIKITARSTTGIFYGIQSLRQLMSPKTEKHSVEELTIPAVTIEDEPRYAYRGMLLDVARHVSSRIR